MLSTKTVETEILFSHMYRCPFTKRAPTTKRDNLLSLALKYIRNCILSGLVFVVAAKVVATHWGGSCMNSQTNQNRNCSDFMSALTVACLETPWIRSSPDFSQSDRVPGCLFFGCQSVVETDWEQITVTTFMLGL